MAKVGAQRAAVLTGRSKSTIQRAMNAGKLSFETDRNGRRVIDVSELDRAFGLKPQSQQTQEKSVSVSPVFSEPLTVEEAVEKERLSMRIKMLEQQLSTASEHIDDLKDQRDKWERQASQALITSQYTQKQAEELRAHIKEREERAKLRRLQIEQAESSRSGYGHDSAKNEIKRLDEQMKKLKAENENMQTEANPSVFRFWKRAKG